LCPVARRSVFLSFRMCPLRSTLFPYTTLFRSEVPELRAARRGLDRGVLLGRDRESPPAGGHRHEDDPHRARYPQHHHLQGHHLRSEEHTSELQSHLKLVCRLLLEKKKNQEQTG